MKKIFTLVSASLFAIVVSATAAQPLVTINTYGNYEVAIDGRDYTGQNTYTVTDLAQGNHTVSVYQVINNGILGIGKKRNLLSTQQFSLYNNDVTINVSQNGQARITNSRNGTYDNTGSTRQRNDGRYDNDDDHDRDHHGEYENGQNTNGRYGKSEGKGNGHKYGHYKNKNKKGSQNSHGKKGNYRKN